MIENITAINTINYQLFGEPIIRGISNHQKNGIYENSIIPTEFEYNGNWTITHQCAYCGCKISLGENFDGKYVKRENFSRLKYLCYKYYENQFLEIFPLLFVNTKLIIDKERQYVIYNNAFELDFPITSSIEPIFYKCSNCHRDHLGLIRQGFPQEPEPSRPQGYLGTIFIDQLVSVAFENGLTFTELIDKHKMSYK